MTETQNNIPDSLVSKIQKLLRMANSENENESNLAMEKAKKLAVEANIDLASISLYDKSKSVEKIEKSELDLDSKRKSVTQRAVTQILLNHFNVKILYSGGRWGGVRLIFIGTKSDIEVAIYLNSYLNEEFLRRWHKYYKKTPGVQLAERNSFIHGLQIGLCEKLNKSEQVTKQESFQTYGDKAAEVSNQYALMVINHEKRLDEAVGEMFPNLRKAYSGRSKRYFHNSYESGKAEGRTISTNRAIGNSSRSMITA